MKKVSIYVRNHELTPSSYYRITQYARNFEAIIQINDIAPTKMYKNNVKLDKSKKKLYFFKSIHYYIVLLIRSLFFILRDCINKPDYIIVSKVILPKYMPNIICVLLNYITTNSVLYWDFDDLLFKSSKEIKKQHMILGNNSKKIIVTSEFLKSKLLDEWKEKCVLLPTTDGDLQIFQLSELNESRKKIFENQINIVWVASNSSMPYLNRIIPILEETAKEIKDKYNKNLVIKVVCDKKLECHTKYLLIENVEWSRTKAISEIFDSHIGIMPLIYSEFALGKGGFKLIQYMSAALPVIASKIGFNSEVVNNKCGILVDDKDDTYEWKEAILSIVESWDKWCDTSVNAYQVWNEKFSFKENLDFWNNLIK